MVRGAVVVVGAMLCGAIAALAEEVPKPRWDVSELHDHVDGGSLGLAQITTPGAEAAVRCSERSGYAEVRFFVDSGLVAGTDTVRWQFDRGAVESGHWNKSPNGRSLIVPATLQAAFIEQLEVGWTLSLFLKDGDGSQHELEVPLRGSEAAIARAMRSCPHAP